MPKIVAHGILVSAWSKPYDFVPEGQADRMIGVTRKASILCDGDSQPCEVKFRTEQEFIAATDNVATGERVEWLLASLNAQNQGVFLATDRVTSANKVKA